MNRHSGFQILALAGLAFAGGLAGEAEAAVDNSVGALTIAGKNNIVISGLKIANPNGDCVVIADSKNVTIERSEIGPCHGRGIFVNGSAGVFVYDNYIHVEDLTPGCPPCDVRDNIFTLKSSNVVIQGNVAAYGESNIELYIGTHDATVTGNFLLNPRTDHLRGVQFQAGYASNVKVDDNYSLSSADTSKYLYPGQQRDAFNFFQTHDFVARHNYVVGGQFRSGCGITVDKGSSRGRVIENTMVNSGQCGIVVAGGSGHTVQGNKILNLLPVAESPGNVGIIVGSFSDLPCGATGANDRIRISDNIVYQRRPEGKPEMHMFDKHNCGTIDYADNITGAAAYARLYPMAKTNPAPLIPPRPHACVARSPYSTQTSAPLCPRPSSGRGQAR
ncbi:MAG TPA: right-handed parallel beta-helix repeat-containing protein [Rhizomicrobium sp.]|jgi:parallel beta-helix repeat protein